MNSIIATIVGSFLSAVVGAIVASVVTLLKTTKRKVDESKLEAEEMRKLIVASTLMTCRIAIYAENFSIDEKVEAYSLYRSLGGNHKTKTYMDEALGMDADDYLSTHKPKK